MKIINSFKNRIGLSESNGKINLSDTKPVSGMNGYGPVTQRPAQTLNAAAQQSNALQDESSEDSLFILYGSTLGDKIQHDYGLFLIADGSTSGGLGDQASSVAVKAASSMMVQDAFPRMLDPHEDSNGGYAQSMQKSVERAHRTVLERAPDSLISLTSVLIMDRMITIAHVGNCRVFLDSKDGFEILTNDHSYAGRLVEAGELTLEEARNHPKGDQLWNTLGADTDPQVDIVERQIPVGGSLLICNKGLWAGVSNDSIQALMALSADPALTSRELVRAADSIGSSKIPSAIAVRFSS